MSTSHLRSGTVRWRAVLVALAIAVGALWPGGASAAPPPASDPPSAEAAGDDLAGALYRLYRGFFLREPDIDGFGHWHCLASKDRMTLADVADAFVAAPEFEHRYGPLDRSGFVDLAYRNLFDRAPDQDGRTYWLDQLDRGLSRGRMMAHLTGSAEYRARTAGGSPPAVDPTASDASTCGPVLLTWVSRGLPDGFSAGVTGIDDVTASTIVHGDLAALVATRDHTGRVVHAPAAGWAIPVDAIAIDPASYAPFQTGAAHDVLARLRPGEAVLTESSARLRGIGVGGSLTFRGGRTLTVSGIVDDRSGAAAEVIAHRTDAGAVGIRTERFMLLRDRDRAAVEQAIRSLTPSGAHVSIRGSADTTYLRHGDRVDPQVHVKRAFGEFTFRDGPGRQVQIDPAWVAANIVTERVPLLGTVRCHRAIIPAVRAALAEVADRGHGHTVNPHAYAGCHYARRIAPGEGLSRHTWGLALDINIGADPRGDYRTQSPVLVQAMRAQGFLWGGDWEHPDPGHYEARA